MTKKFLKKPLEFDIISECNSSRTANMILPNGTVQTPAFMPVGTYGAIKGLTSEKVKEIGYKIILGNTYHLSKTPGADIVEQMGGLHSFENFSSNLLTDSGGFQMVSLLALAKITEAGVTFKNPKDGSKMLLTPEESIHKQNQIGADIIMALDDVVITTSTDEKRMLQATHRTIRWIDRCIKAHRRPSEQNLFGIIQGGLDPKLRNYSLEEMIKRDLPGYAIGGLAGGEDKENFWRIVFQCTQKLPKDKPRYLMGVGYPLDLVVCSALGCDMYDCVYPARAARFGVVFTRKGSIKIRNSKFKNDLNPIEKSCGCYTCKNYTRAYFNGMRSQSTARCSLLTLHNLTYIFDLMAQIRESIGSNRLFKFVREFLREMFGEKPVPLWVKNALRAAGCDLDEDTD